MSFEHFAQAHGLIIQSLELNRWTRVPTTDHPHKRNGSYIYDGQRGAVQNWATHDKPVSWFSDTRVWVDEAEYRKKREDAAKKKLELQRKAAAKGAWILKNSAISTHPYLTAKGFPEEKGNVWNDLLVIPTRYNGSLTGCQLIAADGTKKFLSGQRTQGVCCGFDNKGIDILVEGYATALSVRRALKAARERYKIWVCFSSNNIITVSKGLKNALVIADNDNSQTGINAAKKTGFKYWVAENTGFDFNDYEKFVGTTQAGLEIKQFINDNFYERCA